MHPTWLRPKAGASRRACAATYELLCLCTLCGAFAQMTVPSEPYWHATHTQPSSLSRIQPAHNTALCSRGCYLRTTHETLTAYNCLRDAECSGQRTKTYQGCIRRQHACSSRAPWGSQLSKSTLVSCEHHTTRTCEPAFHTSQALEAPCCHAVSCRPHAPHLDASYMPTEHVGPPLPSGPSRRTQYLSISQRTRLPASRSRSSAIGALPSFPSNSLVRRYFSKLNFYT